MRPSVGVRDTEAVSASCLWTGGFRDRLSRPPLSASSFADRLAQTYGDESELAEAVRVLERLSKALDQVGVPVTEP
ncbi:hypothetical protein [Streptomyces cellulosae]|uniref:hypothetical protein n=1 Tax=Streptomyces cellulosae TaxID=1968 RepID=UPI0004C6801A